MSEDSYTYMWQLQPYKSWKGNIDRNLFNVISGILKKPITEAVPTSGRQAGNRRGRLGAHQLATREPATVIKRISRVGNSQNHKLPSEITPKGLSGAIGTIARIFGPQPQKHWRLQLNTVSQNIDGKIVTAGVYNKKSIANLIDRPGTAFINNKPDNRPNLSNCDSCDPSGNGQYSKEYYNREKLWNIDIDFSYPGEKFLDCSTNLGVCRPVCVACNPENNIIRSAITKLNRRYYTDSRAYLRSRCKTFNQNLNITQLANKDSQFLPNTKIPAWPNEKQCGPQSFLIGTCPDKCQFGAELCGKDIPPEPKRTIAIYKPSNRNFGVEGPVQSSTRIAKLRYQTITKNAASFTTAFGAEAGNAGRFRTNSEGPYFIKSKQFICRAQNFPRPGNQNLQCKGVPTPQQLGLIRLPGRFSGCSGPLGSRNAICN